MARDARTNRRIRAKEVRVIGAQGEQLGILLIEVALSRAGEDGLDLVEVSPMSKPPVCKIMDYGKFKYETKKKASEAKKKQVVVHLKEVKFRPKTEEHDYDFKVKNIRRFLEEGDKARVTIMFRGREITHKDIGQKILEKVTQDLKDIAIVETTPRMEGRQMFMILAINPKWKPPKPPKPVAAPKPSLVGEEKATPAPTGSDVASPPTVAVSIAAPPLGTAPPLGGPQPTPEKMKTPDVLAASKA